MTLPDYTHGFNLGSDARLDGVALDCNPFKQTESLQRYRGWRDGWLDVDGYFGRAARWPVRRLPVVTS